MANAFLSTSKVWWPFQENQAYWLFSFKSLLNPLIIALVKISIFISSTCYRKGKEHGCAWVCAHVCMCTCIWSRVCAYMYVLMYVMHVLPEHAHVYLCVVACMCTHVCILSDSMHVKVQPSWASWHNYTFHVISSISFSVLDLSGPFFPLFIRQLNQLLTPATLTYWYSPEPRPSSEAPNSLLNKTPPWTGNRKKQIHLISRAMLSQELRWGNWGIEKEGGASATPEGEGKSLDNLNWEEGREDRRKIERV